MAILTAITHEGHVLLVDEKAEIKEGDKALTPDGIVTAGIGEGEVGWGAGGKYAYFGTAGFKVVAQPIGSSIPSVSYYQTEEETDEAEQIANKRWPNWYSDYEEGEARRNWLWGHKAAKAKKFTEDDVRKAFSTGILTGRNQVDNENGFADHDLMSENDYITSLRKPRRIVSAVITCDESGNPLTEKKDGKDFISEIVFNYE